MIIIWKYYIGIRKEVDWSKASKTLVEICCFSILQSYIYVVNEWTRWRILKELYMIVAKLLCCYNTYEFFFCFSLYVLIFYEIKIINLFKHKFNYSPGRIQLYCCFPSFCPSFLVLFQTSLISLNFQVWIILPETIVIQRIQLGWKFDLNCGSYCDASKDKKTTTNLCTLRFSRCEFSFRLEWRKICYRSFPCSKRHPYLKTCHMEIKQFEMKCHRRTGQTRVRKPHLHVSGVFGKFSTVFLVKIWTRPTPMWIKLETICLWLISIIFPNLLSLAHVCNYHWQLNQLIMIIRKSNKMIAIIYYR